MKSFPRMILPLLAFAIFAFAQVPAQQPTPATPVPRVEVQPKSQPDAATSLLFTQQENLALKSQLIEQKAKADYQAALAPLVVQEKALEDQLSAYVVATRKANGWGNDVKFDLSDHKFYKTLPGQPLPQTPHPFNRPPSAVPVPPPAPTPAATKPVASPAVK